MPQSNRFRSRPRTVFQVLLAVVLTTAYLVVDSGREAQAANAAAAKPVPAALDPAGPTVIRPMPDQHPDPSPTIAAPVAPMAGIAADETVLTGPVVTSVSQTTDLLDIFGVDGGQRIYHASWRPDDTNGWKRSAQLNGGIAARGTSVHAVSRFNGRLDVFAVGTDRRVYTAFKETGFRRGAWQGWWNIPGLTVGSNTSVHAVKLDASNMMIVATGSDGKVYENFWTAALNVWQGWRAVSGLTSRATSQVYGISMTTSSVDLFALDTVGRPHTATWSSSGWSAWRRISSDNLLAISQAGLFPVKYGFDRVALFGSQLFWMQQDRPPSEYRTSIVTWDRTRNTFSSFGWMMNGRAKPGSSVFATSRRNGYLDVFHVGRDNHVYTAAYNPTDGWGGWWDIGDDVGEGTSVFAQTRRTDYLDIFAISPNTGTYTRGWNPEAGWGCWCEVGPFGQAGDAITQTFHLDFNNGVLVKGWVRIMVSSSGAWNFAGHFHSSGPLTYNVGYAALIAVPSGTGFTFDAKGKAYGWLDGTDDLDWNRAGVNPAIAAAWSEIRSSDWNSKGRASLDVLGLIGNLIDAAVFVIRIQQTVDSYSA